jgi:hypothetical protein
MTQFAVLLAEVAPQWRKPLAGVDQLHLALAMPGFLVSFEGAAGTVPGATKHYAQIWTEKVRGHENTTQGDKKTYSREYEKKCAGVLEKKHRIFQKKHRVF